MSAQSIPNGQFPVVCLAGSAGGLEAYREILRQVSNDSGMTFVVVAHRGLDNPQLLLYLLGRVTEMPVIEAEDGMLLEPNCVFVTPGQTDVTVDGITLRLRSSRKRKGWPTQISGFLASLALMSSSRPVVVMLSGMGHDGSSALRSIRAAGGKVFAQADAIFDSMPQSAIETGFVDFILSATEIGEHLAGMNDPCDWGNSVI